MRGIIRAALGCVAAVTLTLVALAQPQWGFRWEEAKQRGIYGDATKKETEELSPTPRAQRA